MKRFITVSTFALSLVVFGCSAPQGDMAPAHEEPPPMAEPPQPREPQRTEHPPAASPDDVAGMEPSLPEEIDLESVSSSEVVTDFLYPDRDFKPKLGELPTGVVLFDRGEELKNAVLCDAYTKELRTHEEAKAAAPEQDFFVTYWLLANQPENFSSCDALRDAYDYDRAEQIKSEYGLSDAKGPVFLAVDANGDSVFLDLSEADLAATRSAVDEWLKLALANSETSNEVVDTTATDERVETSQPQSRFSLVSFSSNIKAKLISAETGISVDSAKEDGTMLFAYSDPDTGYRLGSTVRF